MSAASAYLVECTAGRTAVVRQATLDLKLLQKRLGLVSARSASRAACLISPNVADKNMPN
jgi:hypothetical protein